MQAKRINVMPQQRRAQPDTFHEAMAAAESLLRAQEQAAIRAQQGPAS